VSDGPAGDAPASAAIAAARALAPEARRRAAEAERDRRLPPELLTAFARAGLFRLCVPRTLGGLEAEPAVLTDAVELIARADGSAGWCVMIGATSGLVSGWLPEDAARAVYGQDPNVITGGVFAPGGRSVPVEGGYRVTGRWPYASGCEHCRWLMGGTLVHEDGGPRLSPAGTPDVRLMVLPSADIEIHDTWWAAGLRATGSHDIEARDRFVPEGYTVSLITERPRHPGALYAFPPFGLLALGIAAVALGIARAAIDELGELAVAKTPTLARHALAARSGVQADRARAEALLRSARAFLDDAVGAAWDAACAGGAAEVGARLRAELRLAATHAVRSAAQAVDLVYDAGGGTAVYEASPLQRHFRDVHTATQHMMVGAPTLELAGRVLLGLPTDTAML
jgi:alkylation response protein AidB-like acyl-CoA dehydrogenase